MTQSTTIRVALESKRRLERLQDRWQRLRGTRPTQQELVAKAFEYLEEHAEAFITDKSWRPWSEQEIERFLAWIGAVDPEGLPTDLSRDIDKHLYGDGPESLH